MTRNTTTDDTTYRAGNIDTISLLISDIEAALRNNAKQARGATDDLRVNPDYNLGDFRECAKAERFAFQHGNRYPPDMSVKPIGAGGLLRHRRNF